MRTTVWIRVTVGFVSLEQMWSGFGWYLTEQNKIEEKTERSYYKRNKVQMLLTEVFRYIS